MDHNTFESGLRRAMSSLQYQDEAETMRNLVEVFGYTPENAFLCICAAKVTIKQLGY